MGGRCGRSPNFVRVLPHTDQGRVQSLGLEAPPRFGRRPARSLDAVGGRRRDQYQRLAGFDSYAGVHPVADGVASSRPQVLRIDPDRLAELVPGPRANSRGGGFPDAMTSLA